MEEAKSELSRIIQDREMRNVVLLVFANKQDVDGGKCTIPSFVCPKTKPQNANPRFSSNATQRRSSGPRPRPNC
jgi:hypothetical protein